jgi:hypothetical protein
MSFLSWLQYGQFTGGTRQVQFPQPPGPSRISYKYADGPVCQSFFLSFLHLLSATPTAVESLFDLSVVHSLNNNTWSIYHFLSYLHTTEQPTKPIQTTHTTHSKCVSLLHSSPLALWLPSIQARAALSLWLPSTQRRFTLLLPNRAGFTHQVLLLRQSRLQAPHILRQPLRFTARARLLPRS